MYTSFTDWESGLIHHGIKGMKWGIRRFQNEDGSLTEAGIARIAKHNRRYLNPDRKDRGKKRASEREKVISERDTAYWKAVSNGMSASTPSKQDRKLWDGYKDKYAGAVLRDAKLKDTKAGREQVKKILRDIDHRYDYKTYDDINQGRIDTREERSRMKAYDQRRDNMIHYKREKIKRGAKMVKSLLETAYTAKKLIKG